MGREGAVVAEGAEGEGVEAGIFPEAADENLTDFARGTGNQKTFGHGGKLLKKSFWII